jgi:predicted alpha-1,2-mannosidase
MLRRLALLACILLVVACDSGATENNNTDASDTTADVRSDATDDASDATDDADAPPEWVRGADTLDYVDPFIGTGGGGFAYAGLTPAVQMPLGMVRLGPDTTNNGSHSAAAHHFSGYYEDDPDTRGFSHLHFVGTGVADYGNLRVTPLSQQMLDEQRPGDWHTDAGEEQAEPGYYRVTLPDVGVDAELTASTRAGLHRYTFSGDGPYRIAIDPASSVRDEGVIAADIDVSGTTIEGSVEYKGPYVGRGRPFTLYFSTVLNTAATAVHTWQGETLRENTTTAGGEAAGAILEWEQLDAPVELTVGISFQSLEQARNNRANETAGGFDAVRQRTRATWRSRLERIRVRGGSEEDRTNFYTALYNTYRMPTRLDEGGSYVGLDGQVHETDHRYVTDLSLWDTYRTLHPWWILFDHNAQRDSLKSLLAMGRDGGYIPRWPAALSYTSGMEGDSGAILFAESAIKGVDDVDYAAAYELLLKTAFETPPQEANYGGRRGIEDFVSMGYIPADEHGGAASNTLEYSVDDQALAELAAFLGEPEEADFRERATHYENIYDTETGFFRPRNADGSFVEDFSTLEFHERSGVFTEGTAWQWRFYVPHDPEGLVALFESPEAFAEELETFMEESKLFAGNLTALFLPDSYYWHTNQPSLHTAFLFGAADRVDLLSKWVREVQIHAYNDAPNGLVGNDDGGTLSAWYVMSALGVYPVTADTRYFVSPPVFPEAEVDLPGGNVLRVEADGASDDVRYIQSVAVDGEEISLPYLAHDDLAAGGTLTYELSDSP